MLAFSGATSVTDHVTHVGHLEYPTPDAPSSRNAVSAKPRMCGWLWGPCRSTLKLWRKGRVPFLSSWLPVSYRLEEAPREGGRGPDESLQARDAGTHGSMCPGYRTAISPATESVLLRQNHTTWNSFALQLELGTEPSCMKFLRIWPETL